MAVILVIDDEAMMRRLIARVLTRSGHVVHEAECAREGIAAFRRLAPELLITDIVMPDTEGIETIRLLHQEAPEVPILAISGAAAPLYLRAAVELGAAASLAKPFAPTELLAVVDGLLGR